MEKLDRIVKIKSKEVVETYLFNNRISIDDISKFIDVLNSSNVKLTSFRLSNSEEQPEHFFRIFNTLGQLNMFSCPDGILIDDFGVACEYNGIRFDLTFDFSTGQVVTFSKGNINLEPLLLALEQCAQKKIR